VGWATGRPFARVHRSPRAGDVRDSQASLERARERIGYRPRIGLAEGLRRTWEWFEARESALTAGPG
jgi:nucleoside-diphosphate-sugar epimerase